MVNLQQLARAWSTEFVASNGGADRSQIQSALQRTLPLLEDRTSVPFVCRYRTDIYQPLGVRDIHQLCDMWQTHKSLESLRQRILPHVPSDQPDLKLRVETSYSKSELEDLYAPFKPPPKGSLEDRIQEKHPELVQGVQDVWNKSITENNLGRWKPREDVVILLANKIASDPAIADALAAHVEQQGRILSARASELAKDDDNDKKYGLYHDKAIPFSRIRDHQILAIRRGLNQKALKVTYDVSVEGAEWHMRRVLHNGGHMTMSRSIWDEAIRNAWTRLLRKRSTNRVWKEKCDRAEEKSIQVFCDNLIKALLAPPLQPPRPVLALDPGFQAGIKCAVLDSNGQLLYDGALDTIKFLRDREKAVQKMAGLLEIIQDHPQNRVIKRSQEKVVTVALGNGHGSQEARDLIREASDRSGIAIDLQLVNEAGASVWSVTEGAEREFPGEQPTAVAAVSIGRRHQNPLPELVKIPPRSLGLGMYQHDLSDRDLDEKLHYTSVHAVAEIGVDGNTCSLEILEKVPGLKKTLCERIIAARPLKTRKDLLTRVSGLGPKTFENAAAFIRIEGGDEILDSTLVHPESYDLARFLLKRLNWDLRDKKSVRKSSIPKTAEERAKKWSLVLDEASKKFDVQHDRVLTVIGHLVVSIINPDPRLANDETDFSIVIRTPDPTVNTAGIGSVDGCSILPSRLSKSMDDLREACPVRGVVATVRNVVDFGAFVDVGAPHNGLIHISKLGPVKLSSLVR